MSRVVHFEIPASDPERTMKFFGEAFGWQFTKFGDNDYWMCKTGDPSAAGINGGIMRKHDPGQPMTNVISVASLDDALLAIENAGGTVVVPKFEIPTVGWLAYFKDPEENIFGVAQFG